MLLFFASLLIVGEIHAQASRPSTELNHSVAKHWNSDQQSSQQAFQGAFEIDVINLDKMRDANEDDVDQLKKASLDCGGTIYGKSSERKVGIRLALPGEFPWQVSLELDHPEKDRIPHFCGGVLIDKQWLLTAAHCALNPMIVLPHPIYWKARFGEHNLKNNENTEKNIGITQIFYYPLFHGYDNDIALMKLEEPVPESPYIKPICLPKETDTFLGMHCMASGWGKVDFASVASEDLRAAPIQVFDKTKCSGYTSQHNISIQHYHLCAGTLASGKGFCQGDSGGPLSCQTSDGNWVLAGLRSFGSGCPEREFPDVYTRVSNFMTWIKQMRGY